MDTSRHQFGEWPVDLLIDYALKVHHRNIREKGPALLELIGSVKGESAAMEEVEELFAQSLSDLDDHLMKEENVLFPYLYELLESKREGGMMTPMHCGTISNPIRVMMLEHEGEVERHGRISELTNGYNAPVDASDEYKKAVDGLREFAADLHEHIHIENDVIFPKSEMIEQEIVLG